MIDKGIIENIIDEAIDLGAKGKIAQTNVLLKKIYIFSTENPFQFWEDNNVANLGKTFYLMLHFDVSDNEEDNFTIAHFAYFYLTRGLEIAALNYDITQNNVNISNSEFYQKFLEISKLRILLLINYGDCFYDWVAAFYRKDQSQNERELALKVAQIMVNAMAYSDINNLEMIGIDYSSESFINETAQNLEISFEFSEKEIKSAKNLHKLLYKNILNKLENKEYNFYEKLS